MRHLRFWQQLIVRNLFLLMETETNPCYKQLYKKQALDFVGKK